MNKNPFVPQPSYTPQQPPLPPGPPPPQPAQPDYTAYWAAAAAQQQQQQQQQQHQAPPVPYNPQWSAPQPAQARPTPEQNALYANYGYGGQAGLHWQQQQRQAQPGAQQPAGHYPAPPVVQPPPPPPQPTYNPYQPAAGYPQPYIPQAAPPAQQPMAVQQPYPPPPQHQPPQYYPQPHPPPQAPQQSQQQPQQPRNNSHLHHSPPQQLPPAKRPRFEPPNGNTRGHQFPPPAQPQFQPPPPPQQQGSQMNMYGSGQNQGHGRGGGAGQTGGGRGGAGGSRGGGSSSAGGRGGGRGGSMSGNRGGSAGGRGGRGGSMFMGSAGGRGGGSGQAAPLRGHGSRGGFGNTKDYHNRRGGSFTSGGGGHSHQSSGSSSFRGGRGQNHSSSRGGRQDGGGGGGSSAFGTRDGPMNSSFSSSGKKDENRRTLTDFKIVGLEMRELGWNWGILPPHHPLPPPFSVKAEDKDEAAEGPDTSQDSVKQEVTELEIPPNSEKVDDVAEPNIIAETAPLESKPAATTAEVPTDPGKDAQLSASASASVVPSPPSRIRIYFHTPVSADDSHPILNATSFSLGLPTPSDSRKGKRKKLEDDDGDLEEEGRGKRPPPRMGGGGSQMSDTASVDMDPTGRGSVAPSVAETTSEADWLMAAIVQDEANGSQDGDGNEDGNNAKLDISHAEDNNDTEVGEGNNASTDLVDTDGHGNRAESLDGLTDPEHAQGPAGLNGHVETGHTSANALIAAAIAAAVNGFKPSATSPNGVNTSTDVVAAAPTEGATAADGDARPTESETITEPKDISGASTASHDDPSSAVTAPDPSRPGEEPSTNGFGYPDTQVPHLLVGGKPLQASASLASTVLDDDALADEAGSLDEASGLATVNPDASQDKAFVGELETETDSIEQEHLPEPPASPTSNTLLSTSSGSTYGEPGSQNTSTSLSAPVSPMKVDGKGARTPSANRLSISYAAGSRRLVVDAGVVEKLKVFRSEGRIEVAVNIERDGENGLKGILIEGLSETTKSYAPLPTLPSDNASPTDPTIPTFTQGPIPSLITLVAHLDTDRPLSEPKWVKTGDVQEWLKSMFGRMFWAAGDAADGWERRIEVVDPDPAPTIWTILESWSANSLVGLQTERQRFLKTHMLSEPENILEILLRLVRGERATPFSGSGSSASITGSSISGPLLAALSGTGSGASGGFAHGEKQTHVSLAVLAIWRMALEYARKAAAAKAGEGGAGAEEAAAVKEVEERVGEVIRCLPGHLVYKSLEGMFKEWKVEKKGGRS